MISALLITLNEEKNIAKAIKSIEGFVDEIVIVDSGSKDGTLKIAKKLGAKVYVRKFDNFANQRNWALNFASYDWVFSLDADEEVPESLAEEIKQAVKTKEYSGYLIPRRNFILGEEIKHSRWSPDFHIWLWKKNYGKWVGDVHEEVMVLGKVGRLKNSKIHRSQKSVREFIESNNFYSQLLAASLYKSKIHFSLLKMFYEVSFEFCIRYFLKLGFLDGWRGFSLSYLMAIYKLMVWIKLWELEKS